MSSMPLDFTKVTFALITGTGRGIGKIATQYLAKKVAPGSKIVGISNLTDKVKQVHDLCEGAPEEVKVDLQIMDLANVDIGEYGSVLDNVLTHPNVIKKHYAQGLIMHNAGTLGDVNLTKNLQNLSTWHHYYELNFFSPVLLNSCFIKKCKPYMNHLFFVNLSSIFTISGIPKLSMYCSAKAARNAYFTVLAEEETDSSVLNYSPGRAKTKFFTELQQKQPVATKGEIITVEQSIEKLFQLLTTGNYKSGSTIDYHGRKLL